jgi:hypothetical protein
MAQCDQGSRHQAAVIIDIWPRVMRRRRTRYNLSRLLGAERTPRTFCAYLA